MQLARHHNGSMSQGSITCNIGVQPSFQNSGCWCGKDIRETTIAHIVMALTAEVYTVKCTSGNSHVALWRDHISCFEQQGALWSRATKDTTKSRGSVCDQNACRMPKTKKICKNASSLMSSKVSCASNLQMSKDYSQISSAKQIMCKGEICQPWWATGTGKKSLCHLCHQWHSYQMNPKWPVAPKEGILLTCTSKIFSLVPPTHLRLHYSLTPPTYSLAPPTYSLAPPLPSHLRLTTFHLRLLYNLAFDWKCLRYFFPQCHDLKPGLLFKLHPPLPSTMPTSKIKLFIWASPPCLPQCHHLKSNSLFKLYSPLPSTMPSSKIKLFI